MTVCFETFGCRLNRAEALEEEARYVAAGWEVVTDHAKADTLVVRCCSVTSRAQRDSEKLIEHLKKKYPAKKVVVTGCLEKRNNEAARMPPAIPDGVEPLPMRTARAHLKVQDGCAGKCAFCIVPKFRGPSVSEDFEALVEKAKRFVDAGYHEIVVTGCNLSCYCSHGKRLADLVAALCAVSPDCRVRLGSVEPSDAAAEIPDLMAVTPNLCRFLHVPAQSGSDRILAAMRRPYGVVEVTALFSNLMKKNHGVGIGCDLMTGFPGESELDFRATREFLLRYPFVKAHIFPFSARPGTPAATMPEQVDRETKIERALALGKAAKAGRERFAHKLVGHDVEIIVEHRDKIAGWTSEYVWASEEGGGRHAKVQKREKVVLRIHSADGDKLKGRIVQNGR